MRLIAALAIATAVLATSTPEPASATRLSCRKGVSTKTFAKAHFDVPSSRIREFHDKLTPFAEANGLSVSGVEASNSENEPPYNIATMLQSKGLIFYGVTKSGSSTATVYVQNLCWAESEPWKPMWERLIVYIRGAGFEQVQ